MHHTDYSHNLRKTQHKTVKSLSTDRSNVNRDTQSHQELLRATIAVLLVIVALMQMDPANAHTSNPVIGNGKLVLNENKATHGSQPDTTEDFEKEKADSVAAVVQSVHSMTPIYPTRALLPL